MSELVEKSKNENTKSVMLTLQRSLFSILDPNIITTLSEDGYTLMASNISEQNIKYVQFIANNPSFNGTYMSLEDVKVTLDNNLLASTVYGLYDILNQRVKIVEVNSFMSNKTTYCPFYVNFTGGTVPELTDKISSLAESSINTYGHVKKYTLIFRIYNNSSSHNSSSQHKQES